MYPMRLSSILLLFIVFACREEVEVLPYYNTPDFMPHFITNEEEILEKIDHTILDFNAFDQNNLLITQKQIEGKIVTAKSIGKGGLADVQFSYIKNEYNQNKLSKN